MYSFMISSKLFIHVQMQYVEQQNIYVVVFLILYYTQIMLANQLAQIAPIPQML